MHVRPPSIPTYSQPLIYPTQALTEMTRTLRSSFGEPKNGLVLANGGMVTHQYVVCLSSRPRKDGKSYPVKNPLPEVINDWQVPRVEERAEGEAWIEVYFYLFPLSRNRLSLCTDIHSRVQPEWKRRERPCGRTIEKKWEPLYCEP